MEKTYTEEFLAEVDAYVAHVRQEDSKLGRFVSGEAHTAYEQGRLEEWYAEVTA